MPAGIGYKQPLITDNPWRPFVDQDFGRAFSAYRPTGGSRNFIDFFRGERGRVEDEYERELARGALMGRAPTTNPTDFLANYDFLRRYNQLSNRQRGTASPSGLNPSLRFNLPR